MNYYSRAGQAESDASRKTNNGFANVSVGAFLHRPALIARLHVNEERPYLTPDIAENIVVVPGLQWSEEHSKSVASNEKTSIDTSLDHTVFVSSYRSCDLESRPSS